MQNDFQQALTLAVLACAVGNASGQTAAAVDTVQQSNPFVVQAEAAYKGHLEAERAGNLALYKKFRSKAAVNETIENLRKAGTPESDAGSALQRISKYSTTLDGYDFVKADGKASAGRLFYQKRWKSNGEDTVDFLGYSVRLEDNAWKVECVVNSTGTKRAMNIKSRKIEERTIDELAEYHCLKMN
ncbi:MAG: hypothetical protein V4858_13870 [Pseudomonadota bacterium]